MSFPQKHNANHDQIAVWSYEDNIGETYWAWYCGCGAGTITLGCGTNIEATEQVLSHLNYIALTEPSSS